MIQSIQPMVATVACTLAGWTTVALSGQMIKIISPLRTCGQAPTQVLGARSGWRAGVCLHGAKPLTERQRSRWASGFTVDLEAEGAPFKARWTARRIRPWPVPSRTPLERR